jgi:hypothetical protein
MPTRRDEMPDGMRRFQPADSRPSPNGADGAAPSPTDTPEALRRAIVERHGEVLGDLLFEAEVKKRTAAAEKFRQLKASLDTVNAALDVRLGELEKRLIPLRAAMGETYTAWLRACEALEAQRIRNQAELAPLEARRAELISELNRPAFSVRQWGIPDWYEPNSSKRYVR